MDPITSTTQHPIQPVNPNKKKNVQREQNTTVRSPYIISPPYPQKSTQLLQNTGDSKDTKPECESLKQLKSNLVNPCKKTKGATRLTWEMKKWTKGAKKALSPFVSRVIKS